MKIDKSLMSGSTTLLVLSLLSGEEMYGYQMITELARRSNHVFDLKEGTLYPILTRQKNAGLLTYRWEESPQGPPRKYYTLTEKGREQLNYFDEAWDELVGQIQKIRHAETETEINP